MLRGLIVKEIPRATDYSAFLVGRNGQADASSLLGSLQFQYDAAKRASRIDAPLSEPVKPAEKALASRIANIKTAIEGYDRLKAKLLGEIGGIPLASVVRQQEANFASNYSDRPILYILNHDAVMTTITKKGMFTGLRSTPATMSVMATVDYLILASAGRGQADPTPTRGTVRCAISAVPFDSLSKNNRKHPTIFSDDDGRYTSCSSVP